MDRKTNPIPTDIPIYKRLDRLWKIILFYILPTWVFVLMTAIYYTEVENPSIKNNYELHPLISIEHIILAILVFVIIFIVLMLLILPGISRRSKINYFLKNPQSTSAHKTNRTPTININVGQPLESYGKPREIIRAELKQFFGEAPIVEAKQDHVRGKMLQWLGLFMLVIGIFLLLKVPSFFFYETLTEIFGEFVSFLEWVIGLIIFSYSFIVAKISRRLLFPSAKQLLTEDERLPIIYLRSFDNDDLKIIGRLEGDMSDNPYGEKSFEESLADQFGLYGPLVTIGQPGEKNPALGASRAYFTNDKWRARIIDWMDKARLIVMIPGKSDGVRWELNNILNKGYISKMLLLFPPSTSLEGAREERNQLLKILNEIFQTLPGFAATKDLDMKDVIAIRFRDDGGLVVLRNERHQEVDYENAIELAAFGMFIHDWGTATESSNTNN